MRGGVRIVHTSARSSVVVYPDLSRPYPVPLGCPTCQTIHQAKSYHVNVNADGAAIVSPGVFAGLQRARAFGGTDFRVDAAVPDPPKQVLGMNGRKYAELKQRDKIALWHR